MFYKIRQRASYASYFIVLYRKRAAAECAPTTTTIITFYGERAARPPPVRNGKKVVRTVAAVHWFRETTAARLSHTRAHGFSLMNRAPDFLVRRPRGGPLKLVSLRGRRV